MKPRRYWTEDERSELDLMLQQGYSVPAIARRLKCDVMRIYNYTKGGHIRTMRAQVGARVHSLESVRRLFGVHKNTPPYWIARGWLKVRRNKATAARFGSKSQRPFYLVTDAALLAFIDNRETWVAWSPATITDPDWRAHAETVRAAANGYWMTTKHVANRFGYSAKTVPEWVRHGRMQDVQVVKYGSLLFFWSADIERWTPPLDRRYAV